MNFIEFALLISLIVVVIVVALSAPGESQIRADTTHKPDFTFKTLYGKDTKSGSILTGTVICLDGVEYVKFGSSGGLTAKLNKDSLVSTC